MAEDLSLSGFSVARIYEEVSSTMDVARELVPQLGEKSGVVCALRQTAGRGRQGRTWSSNEGALMATFLFQSSLSVATFSGYSLAIGVGLVEAFKEFGASLQLKWPNDLVIVREGSLRKVGGILIEVQDLGPRRVLMVGVGVNLRTVPDGVEAGASIEEICRQSVSHRDVVFTVSGRLSEIHDRFVSASGFEGFRTTWEAMSCFESGVSTISLDDGSKEVTGTYLSIDDRGSLVLRVEGEVRTFHSGHLLRMDHLRR